jgi:hypothetical protein
MGLGVASFSVVSQNLVLLGLAGELRVFGLDGVHAGGGLLCGGSFFLSAGIV